MTHEYLDLAPLSAARGRVRLPGSKSISNRVLLLSALAQGTTEIRDLLSSDDTDRMLDALESLGVKREWRDGVLYVTGVGGPFPVKEAALFLGNSGTSMRSLAAAAALSGGAYHLYGVPRMHERPIGDLVDALRSLGADLRYLGEEGYPPLQTQAASLSGASTVAIKGNVSSQFLTGLLMALPLTGQQVTVEVIGELISKPYIEITLDMMARYGIKVEREGWQRFVVPVGTYQSPGQIYVEGDASSASYFLAAGAIGHGPVRVEGVGSASTQGDVAFAEALSKIGVSIAMSENWIEAALPAGAKLRAFDRDFNHIPDAAMGMAVVALFCDGPCILRNIASWRVKETDRIEAMATELRKLGADVAVGPDWLRVTPPEKLNHHVAIDTYDDHRIAMCFSLVALAGVPVRINDPKCTAKTFPDYFEVFASVTE